MKIEDNQLTVTCGELLKIQLIELDLFNQEEYFCIVIQEMCGHRRFPVSSEHVIDQFKKAVPERFVKNGVRHDHTCILHDHMLSKFKYSKTPRINLLKSIPSDYVFTFQLK